MSTSPPDPRHIYRRTCQSGMHFAFPGIETFSDKTGLNMKSRENLLQVLFDFENRIDEMFKELVHDRWAGMDAVLWEPHVDVIETAGEVIVLMDIPGIDPGKVTVQQHGHVLEVYGSRTQESGRTSFRHLAERKHGPFKRRIELDEHNEYGRMRREYRNGVLALEIEKEHTDTTTEEM
ncbi:MAG: Hsp20 family protein [Chitinivibrionales bacterium]|nr:Hsp20 family protein [Chitinivibrionales bacterium]